VLGPRYAEILRQLFQCIADGTPGDALVAQETETARALGVALAGVLRAQMAEEWAGATGRCPWCGGPAEGCA
jgi:hypothetical protein